MKRSINFFIEDILENIERIESFSTDLTKKELRGNKPTPGEDVVIHSYLGMNLEQGGKIVRDDFPLLKKQIQKVKDGKGKNDLK